MKQELREKIIAYNQALAEREEKASDLEMMISEIMKLPPGQLKKVLTKPVLEILEKYSVKTDGEYIE